MTVTAHVAELKRRHRTLSDQVEAAQRAPAADDLELVRLKKQKLHLKEEIVRLSAH